MYGVYVRPNTHPMHQNRGVARDLIMLTEMINSVTATSIITIHGYVVRCNDLTRVRPYVMT